MKTFIWLPVLTALVAAGLGTWTEAQAAVVAPVALAPGATVTSLPNGGSSGDGVASTTPFDETLDFSFADGLSGTLRERVIDYADTPSANHPGLYFDYEIGLATGSVASFTSGGYGTFQTAVKLCGIAGCGGSGADGVSATDARRSTDGDRVTFDFADALSAGQHSANLQLFTSAALFADPLAYFTDASGDSFAIEVIAPAVPEPSAWTLIGLGLAGMGRHLRTRKARTDVAGGVVRTGRAQ